MPDLLRWPPYHLHPVAKKSETVFINMEKTSVTGLHTSVRTNWGLLENLWDRLNNNSKGKVTSRSTEPNSQEGTHLSWVLWVPLARVLQEQKIFRHDPVKTNVFWSKAYHRASIGQNLGGKSSGSLHRGQCIYHFPDRPKSSCMHITNSPYMTPATQMQ